MRKMIVLTAAILTASMTFGQAGAKVAPVTVGQAPNSSAFGTNVYFAGQPSRADLSEYARLGVKTVVNLRSPAEMEKVGFDEEAAAKAAGMRYVNVPIGGTMPTDGDLAKIYAELNKSGQAKVLLHCASSNRVGMTWAMYRGTQNGMPAEAALAEGKAAGLKAPALESLVKEKLGVKP
jgi:uncharacterized protein (TIGR01244 family)